MINQLKSYRNGVHGQFFLEVAAELERLQKLADARLETIKAMSGYLDDVAEALGVAKPSTPVEGIGACWKVMGAIQALQASATAVHGVTADDLPGVAGRRLPCSNSEFERRCQFYIKREVEGLNGDTALVGVLCDAVRMVREYSDYMQAKDN